MKIGLVLHRAPGYSETFFLNKIRILKEKGIEVFLFVDGGGRHFDLCTVYTGFSFDSWNLKSIILLIKSIFLLFLNPILTSKLWKANKRDHFSLKENLLSLLTSAHIMNIPLDWLHFGYATTVIGRENLARTLGAKLAVSIRGYDVNVFPIKHLGVYDLLWKRLDKLHYLSDGLLNRVIDLGFNTKIAHEKITPAIDLEVFKLHNYDKNTNKFPILITSVARLHWIKGLSYVLEALAILKSRGFNFQYRIIGDGLEFEHLVFVRNQLKLNDEVIFVGRLGSHAIRDVLYDSDIYIQYSLEEGFCNAVLEAQLMGCLCVVSDAEGLKENILDQITGFVVEKRNPTLLAKKLERVISMNNSMRSSIRKNAIERVRNEFNIVKQSAEFVEFYNL